MEAYSNEEIFVQEENEDELEKTLDDLDFLENNEESLADPEIQEIRKRLISVSGLLMSNPGFDQWKNAVHEAAIFISKKHFPESDHPLEEAVIGPLLEKTHAWVSSFSKGEDLPLVNRFYKMRLDTLYRSKSLSDTLLPRPFRSFVEKALKTYGWLRWPLKTYQLAKKSSPWKIALEVGWIAAKKASLAHICGKTFDKACKELESVYSRSRELKKQRSK